MQVLRNLRANYVQVDELWGFVGKKQKRVRVDDPEEPDPLPCSLVDILV